MQTRRMSKLFLICSLLIAVGGFWGCTKKVEEKGMVLHFATTQKLKGMDPAYTSDLYSSREVNRVYEGLFQYHYLKRPYVLEPLLATEMPTPSKDNLTYVFRIKKGVMFHDDASFPEGKGREMKAKDFVYSLMRIGDPNVRSTGWWVLEGRIKGLDAWRKSMKSQKTSDYSAVIVGLKATDDYTMEINLTKPYPQLLNVLAMPYTAVVPREAVEKYGKEFINHAVGTGPFILDTFMPSEIVTYNRNPNYWDSKFPSVGESSDSGNGLLAYAGKKLPIADRVEVKVIVENQPRWMNFLKGNLDLTTIPKDNFKDAITVDVGLTKEFESKGISLSKVEGLDFTYTAFNLESDVIPQFKDRRIRRAISLALSSDVDRMIKLFYNGMAVPAQTPLPKGLSGYRDEYKNPYRDGRLQRAKKYMADAGYPNGEGFPEIPYDIVASTNSRQIAEFQAKSLKKLGLKLKIMANTWPEFQKRVQRRQAHFWGMAWGADYPDAENFLQLYYGPNAQPGGMNGAYFKNKKFDAMFEKARLLQDTPQRTALYERLAKIVAEEVPVVVGVHRVNLGLTTTMVEEL